MWNRALLPVNKFKAWPLFSHLVIAFVATFALAVTVIGWVTRSQEQSYLTQRQHEHVKQIYSAVAATSLEAVITEDRGVLKDVTKRIIDLQPGILSMAINNEDGQILARSYRSSVIDGHSTDSYTHDFIYEGEHFGSVTFVWGTQTDIDAIDKHVTQLRLILIFVLVIMAAGMLLWIYWLVVKPISQVNDHIERLHQGNPKPPLGIAFPPELSRLSAAINMLGNLLATQKEREQELEERVKKRTSELQYRAQRDSLTGLYNRTVFEERLKALLVDAKTNSTTHALLYIDLDQFKLVNDTRGHIAGDQLLKQLSETLQLHIRKGDCLARMGGDEFTLLASDCSLEGAQRIATTILEAIRGLRFAWENQTFNVGASIGIAAITANSESADEVLSHADIACYMAKDLGRNRIHIFHEHDNDARSRKEEMLLASEINEAIEEDRLVMYCQEIASVTSGESRGRHFEMLVRMQSRDGAINAPGMFLPAAERFNLMAKIDRKVIQNTLGFLSQPDINIDQVELCCINLSGQSFCSDDFLAFLVEAISDITFPSHKLCFEITETVAISNITKVKTVMDKLKEMGCKFALDDFGSGMSSFAYLKHLPVDYLKIDGLFVKNMTSDPVDQIMVNSINEVGHALGIKTIAEFVENDAILAALQSLGVDFAQGYGIAKPVPLSQLDLRKTGTKKGTDLFFAEK